MAAIANDGLGWEHVSVRSVEGHKNRVPIWVEMRVASQGSAATPFLLARLIFD